MIRLTWSIVLYVVLWAATVNIIFGELKHLRDGTSVTEELIQQSLHPLLNVFNGR